MPPKLSSRRETLLGFQPPAVGDEEVAAVADAIRSGWLTTGPRAEELERRFAGYVGAKHALAVSSGTAAMHLALVALGIGPGDEVITTPLTWPATANVIVHTGATPVFADIRDSDLNIDPERVAELVTPRTKAVMPVHLYGQPADLDPIWALGIPVVEDAAHAAESEYRGRKIGGLSEATCFSLYATKSIAAGEGGIVATNDDGLAERIRDLTIMRRGHGSLYDIAVPGYKANLSDVLAAIALCQLDKVVEHRAARMAQIELYDAAVAELDGIEPVARDPRDTHAHHLFVVRVDEERAGASRDEYRFALAEENIGTSVHFLPVHELTAYRERYPDQAPLPVAERAGAEVLSLPLSPAHSLDDIQDAIDALCRVHTAFNGVKRRSIRVGATLVVTGLCTAYILWKIDLGKTVDILRNADLGYFFAAVAIMVVTVWPMAWRWQKLLAGRGIHDRLAWLTRAYFTAYTAGQVLPTSVGGDAMRIFETRRRHPGNGGPIAGSVLLERALGGAATLALAAIGFVLAIGNYDVGAYLWVELGFVLATVVLGVVLFSRRMRRPLAWTVPILRRARLEKPLRAVYEGIHAYRNHPWLLVGVCALTLGIQAVRVLAIWLTAKSVGVDLSPRVYYVMGPLLFLVMLVPFTINGLAVREAFFVSFLTKLGVSADAAFATGFLFFVVTIALSLPGAVILAWEGLRGTSSRRLEHTGSG